MCSAVLICHIRIESNYANIFKPIWPKLRGKGTISNSRSCCSVTQ